MEKDITSQIEEYENRKEQIDAQREDIAAIKAEYQKQITHLEDQIANLRRALEKELEPIKRNIQNQEDELEDYAQNIQVSIKFGDIVQEISDITGTPVQDINVYGNYSYSFSPLDIYNKDEVTKEDFLKFDNDDPLHPIYLHLSAVGKTGEHSNCSSFEFTHTFRCHLLDIQSDGKTLLEHSNIKPKIIESNGSYYEYTSLVLNENHIKDILCPFTLKQVIAFKNNLLGQATINCLDRQTTKGKQKKLTI